MEPFNSINMQQHPCYTFLQRMTNCVKTEELSSRMCYAEIEDWVECKSRRKHRAFHNYLRTEANQMEMLSLPQYDIKSDSFKDGQLPANVDAYFNKPASEQKFYN